MLVPTLASCSTARSDRLAGRIAAKRAIAAHCAISPDEVLLVGQSGAAPVGLVRNDDASWKTLSLSISISHHDGVGLAAVVDRPARVGVDLARVGEIDPDHYRYFLAPSELSLVEAMGATAVWALKEAAWKALALSAETPFASLELAVDEFNELSGLRVDGWWIPASARTWSFARDLVAAAVYVETELE